eukprot:381454-Amphidinium_carterae.1
MQTDFNRLSTPTGAGGGVASPSIHVQVDKLASHRLCAETWCMANAFQHASFLTWTGMGRPQPAIHSALAVATSHVPATHCAVFACQSAVEQTRD